MVTRDHDGADAGALGLAHHLLRLFAGRVDHADHTQEDEVLFDAVVHFPLQRIGPQRAEGNAKRTQRFAGEPFARSAYLLAAFIA